MKRTFIENSNRAEHNGCVAVGAPGSSSKPKKGKISYDFINHNDGNIKTKILSNINLCFEISINFST